MKKLVIALSAATFLAGCTSDPYTGQTKVANTFVGAGAGAAVGALGGLLVGKTTNASTRKAVLIGAGIGALGGGAVGGYMDKQEADLRRELRASGVSVTRNGDMIVLNMPSNITFASNQSGVQSSFYPTLDAVAKVLKKYNRTLVNVYGHTDSDGSFGYNKELSQARAVNVAQYLVSRGTRQDRFYVVGYGEERPVASNASAAGKAQNRRVEIQIEPLRG